MELQTLLLLELRTFAAHRVGFQRNPYEARNAYYDFLAKEFPKAPNRPVFAQIEASGRAQDMPRYVAKLRAFVSKQVEERSISEDGDLLLGLEFKRDFQPSFSTICAYYTQFRDTAKRTATGLDNIAARDAKAIRGMFDFPLPSVRTYLTETNAVGVVLPFARSTIPQLNMGPSFSRQLEREAEAGLKKLVDLVQWASGTKDQRAAVKILPNDDVRRLFATCAMSLLPANDVGVVKMGGEFLRARDPQILLGTYAVRLRGILDRTLAPEDDSYAVTAPISTVDFDQRKFSIRVGKSKVACWVDMNESLMDRVRVAVGNKTMVRVVGSMYRNSLSKLKNDRRYLVVRSVEPGPQEEPLAAE
ncbi:MAG: hypothetical protein R3F14_17555 [Polyangiaceae bacterium]